MGTPAEHTPPVEVRKGAVGDLEPVARLFNAYLGTGSMALDPLDRSDFSYLLEDERSALFVATSRADGQVIGYASVKPWSPRAGLLHRR